MMQPKAATKRKFDFLLGSRWSRECIFPDVWLWFAWSRVFAWPTPAADIIVMRVDVVPPGYKRLCLSGNVYRVGEILAR